MRVQIKRKDELKKNRKTEESNIIKEEGRSISEEGSRKNKRCQEGPGKKKEIRMKYKKKE